MREMTDMDIREAVKNKEKYGEIAEYFKAKNFFSAEDLVLLIDAIEQMSPQIYEHYRALQDVFRREIKAALGQEGADINAALKLAVSKGCATGTLLAEKYAQQ